MTQKTDTVRHPKKRPYHAPKLTVHGDLRTIALAKGGGSNDGSRKPRTKASGTNA